MSASLWFAPTPSDVSNSRLSLDFGVRSADLAFRELVVPGLGRVWFVRQLSWAVAALALRAELVGRARAPKASAIAHGIEALASKLVFRTRPDAGRLLGTRAFRRDDGLEVWDFERLHRRAHYVQNTQRQAASRALRTEGGLGLASGARFDLYELEEVGKNLASAFLEQPVGRGGGKLRSTLLRWVAGESDAVSPFSRTLPEALGAWSPSAGERGSVRARLLETTGNDAEKRRRLAKAIGSGARLPSIEDAVVPRLRRAGHEQQAKEVLAARAFGTLLGASRAAVAEMTGPVEGATGGVAVATLARSPRIRSSTEAVREAAGRATSAAVEAGISGIAFESSRRFISELSADGGAVRIVEVLSSRSGGLLSHVDGRILRGPLFRVLQSEDEGGGGGESIDPEEGVVDRDGTFRIESFHSLLRDLDGDGAS